MPSQPSVLSLLKNLTHGQPALAYDALLDLTGEFRAHGTNHDVDVYSLLNDTIIEMYLYGRCQDGEMLRSICNQLLSTDGNGSKTASNFPSSAILVLLLCTRNIQHEQTKLPTSIFRLNQIPSAKFSSLFQIPTDPLNNAYVNNQVLDNSPNIFSEPPDWHNGNGFEPSSAFPFHSESSDNSSSTSHLLTERFDCIANSARLNIEEESILEIKLQEKELSTSSNDPLAPDLLDVPVPAVHPSYSILASKFLQYVKSSFLLHETCTNPMKLIYDTLSVPKQIAEPVERDEEFLYYILCRCVSDPDVDDATTSTISSSPNGAASGDVEARSPLSLMILQEADVLEDEIRRTHTDRARCIHRRRIVMANNMNFSQFESPSTSPSSTDIVSDLILRSASCGAVYRDLLSFADAYTTTTMSIERRTLFAVAEFVYRFTRVYFQKILSVANDEKIVTDEGIAYGTNVQGDNASKRASAVVHAAEMFIADGCLLAEALTHLEETDGSAVIVIDTLMEECEKHGGSCGSETMMQLFYTAVTPYFDYILDWVFEGSTRKDLGAECFATVLGVSPAAPERLQWSEVETNNNPLENSDHEADHVGVEGVAVIGRRRLPPFPNLFTREEVIFLIRAGRGRNLLELFGLNRGVLADRLEDVSFGDMSLCYEDVMKDFCDLADRVENFEDDFKLEDNFETKNDLDDDKAFPDVEDEMVSPTWKLVQADEFDFGTGRRRRLRNKFCKHEDEIRYIDGTRMNPSTRSPDCVRCTAFHIPSDVENEYRDNGDFNYAHDESTSMKSESESRNGWENFDLNRRKLFKDDDNGELSKNSHKDPLNFIFSSVIPRKDLAGASSNDDDDDVESSIELDNVDTVMPGSQHRPRFPLGCTFLSEFLKPIARIDAVVQREVLQHFINKLELLDHFRNLRAHVLLGAGDFANELIEQIEIATHTSRANEKFITQRQAYTTGSAQSGVEGERIVRERAYLNQCLKTAFNLCSSVSNSHTELLYLDSESGVASKEMDKNERGSSFGEQKRMLWDYMMEMKYDVGFPLNIVITDEAMKLYSKVFRLFLRVLRAQKSLRWMFMASRLKRANARLSSFIKRDMSRDFSNSFSGAIMKDVRLAGRVWQFCWYADHFVSIFGGFVMEQVLGSCWEEFKSKWDTIRSIWELRDAHMLFLEGCVRKCLLGERHRAVLKVMTGGFEIVVNVEKEILKLNVSDVVGWSEETRNVMDLLASATASLKRRCAFLTDVLERLLDGGTLPHLEYLLTRLNFNHYYETAGFMSSTPADALPK